MTTQHLTRFCVNVRIFFGLLFGLGLPCFAADTLALQHPAILNPVWMDNAVQIRVTPKGQKLFSDDLMLIISNLGLVINENYFPSFDYVSDESINIDELAKTQPEHFEMLIKVRQFFKQYVHGLEFKDFKPSLKIGNSQYIADIAKLSLVTDEELMKSLGKKDGAVLSIKISINSINAKVETITGTDLANPWMGQIGVLNPETTLGSPAIPLTVQMPFYVRVDQNGILQFEALKIEENLDQIPIEVKYQKIILPQFEFKVAGQEQIYKIQLNEEEFKKLIDLRLPGSLQVIRKYARDFMQNEFPKTLNQRAQESLKGTLEEIQPVPAANSQPGDKRPPFSLGLKLSTLNVVDSQWAVGLSAFMEDTSLSASTPLWSKSGARGPVNFNHLNPDKYDIAIAIDRAVLNRAVHLSANRKNFKKVETCPGQPTIELLSPPAIDFNPRINSTNDLEAHLTAYIDALVVVPEEYRTKWGVPILKDKLHLSLKFQTVIKPTAPGSTSLSIHPTGPDLTTLVIDPNSLRTVGKIFVQKVRSEIEKILSSSASCGNSSALAEFDLISSVWGIALEYAKIKMDPQGHLMLYMNYKKTLGTSVETNKGGR